MPWGFETACLRFRPVIHLGDNVLYDYKTYKTYKIPHAIDVSVDYVNADEHPTVPSGPVCSVLELGELSVSGKPGPFGFVWRLGLILDGIRYTVGAVTSVDSVEGPGDLTLALSKVMSVELVLRTPAPLRPSTVEPIIFNHIKQPVYNFVGTHKAKDDTPGYLDAIARMLPGAKVLVSCPRCTSLIETGVRPLDFTMMIKPNELIEVVMHLNDDHKESRDSIADWIDSLHDDGIINAEFEPWGEEQTTPDNMQSFGIKDTETSKIIKGDI